MGFRALIGEAITLAVPVLTGVNALNQGDFLKFSTGVQIGLEAREDALIDWFQSLG